MEGGSQKLFLGIDAGSTKTLALLADKSGNVLGEGRAPTCNLAVCDHETAAGNLSAALTSAAQAAGLQQGAEIDSVFIGAAGISSPEEEAAVCQLIESTDVFRFRKIRAGNDILLVLAGGLGGKPGIVLISGTGSNCFGRRADGQTASAGGLEWLIDDRGSGFKIGLEGIVAAVRAADGRGAATSLQNAIFDALGIEGLPQIISRLHGRGGKGALIAKSEVAALAPLVIEKAGQGDQVAATIIQTEVAELRVMLATVAKKLGMTEAPFHWTVAGSVGNCPAILTMLRQDVAAELPSAVYLPQQLPPERGAILLAAEIAGLSDLENLKNTLANS